MNHRDYRDPPEPPAQRQDIVVDENEHNSDNTQDEHVVDAVVYMQYIWCNICSWIIFFVDKDEDKITSLVKIGCQK